MNSIKRAALLELIEKEDTWKIFIQHLNWDSVESAQEDTVSIKMGEDEYIVRVLPVAEKRGFVVCDAFCDKKMPSGARRKLQREVSKSHYEYLLILRGGGDGEIWMVSVKHADKPTRNVEVFVPAGMKSPYFLLEKLNGLIFSFADEEGLTITDVVGRVSDTFAQNAENVTTEFYNKFRDELEEFRNFIHGLQQQVDKEQYASLMLNRLMFVFFIQNKGFLDNNPRYLQTHFQQHKNNRPQDGNSFYASFYRHFIMALFHSGLGAPETMRDPEIQKRIGKVPYLNGGLFDVHELEQQYRENIDIDDSAFERIFKFFDEYRWHLDDRPNAISGKDINPDVIGYIFEKYINERAKLGAYYTQEDITNYIARNTILPHLLRCTRDGCREAFSAETGTIWKLLRDNPDRYIHYAAKKGGKLSEEEMPEDIRIGINPSGDDLLQRREKWNTLADEKYALKGETWREMLARQTQYKALRDKIEKGEICDFNDLITHNLDIEKLTHDMLTQHEGSDLISAFFHVIAGRKKTENSNAKEQRGITVLDPACGSGAFLFAALNVLSQLYDKCIKRMREFVEYDDAFINDGKRKGTKRHKYFRHILAEADSHVSEQYWIYRSIILNNLFGVDIMPEATEVAKLRLFLKLAAVAEKDDNKPNMGLEPLPDIDFNIRAGNTLVGFASNKHFDEIDSTKLDLTGSSAETYAMLETVSKAYKRFIESQVINDVGTSEFRQAKLDLSVKLKNLNQNLDMYLAEEYILMPEQGFTTAEFHNWQVTHKPFHWLSEFYEIIRNGGFDVIIGNPPYVKYTESADGKTSSAGYALKKYQTIKAKDLYVFMLERSLSLLSSKGQLGMIVPISITASDRCHSVRTLFSQQNVWISNFADRPSSLFADAHQMLTILIANHATKGKILSSSFYHWYADERNFLFGKMSYAPSATHDKKWGKLAGNDIEQLILKKILRPYAPLSEHIKPRGRGQLISVCSGTGGYYLRAFDVRQESNEYKNYHFSPEMAVSIAGIINSNIFYWYWRKFSNCRHLRMGDLKTFSVPITDNLINDIAEPSKKAIAALSETKELREGDLTYYQYRPAKVKHYFDEIDKLLAKHYDLTEEETDYIVNYDYKYRKGGPDE